MLSSDAPLSWPETLVCPRQLSGTQLPKAMAGLAFMALAGNLGSGSRLILGKEGHHPFSPGACECRQCWREISWAATGTHGQFEAANQRRIQPALH